MNDTNPNQATSNSQDPQQQAQTGTEVVQNKPPEQQPMPPEEPKTPPEQTPMPAEQPSQPVEQPAQPAPPAEQPPQPSEQPNQAMEVPNPAPPATPEAITTEAAAAPPQPQGTLSPSINVMDWDKKTIQLNKSFYKAFSPRLLGMPFSFAIDVNRARQGATKKGYNIPKNAMVLSKSHFILGAVMIEVEGTPTDDKKIVTLNSVYTKVVDGSEKAIKNAIPVLEGELGAPPEAVYVWYVMSEGSKKAVLVAVPQATAQPAQPTQ